MASWRYKLRRGSMTAEAVITQEAMQNTNSDIISDTIYMLAKVLGVKGLESSWPDWREIDWQGDYGISIEVYRIEAKKE